MFSLQENEILEDNRRLTVAVTRAKHKLLVIGDVKTLYRYKPFQRFFDCLPPNQMTVLSDGNTNFEWNRLLVNVRKSFDGMCPL
jgi:DNA replication ATP-dependent helicase Dna2